MGQGGLRDVCRNCFEQQWDPKLLLMSRNFHVGENRHACEHAFGVACSIGEATYARARVDATKNRPRHAGRASGRQSQRSAASEALDAWIRDQRKGMEGDKKTGVRWFFTKLTERELWARYVKCCDDANLPTSGNSNMLGCSGCGSSTRRSPIQHPQVMTPVTYAIS